MRKKIYRAAAIATIISCIAMALFTWYVVGITEKSNTETTLKNRVDQVTEMLDDHRTEYDAAVEQIYEDYKSKARALALLISKNSELMEDESRFEILRMIIGAEVIIVTDENMNVEYTTGSAGGEQEIYSSFRGAVNSKVFSEAIIDREQDSFKVVAGSSRLDKKGIVQIEFLTKSIKTFLEFTDISGKLTGTSVMKSGCLGVIDEETMNYISHTNEEMVGKASLLDREEDFPEEEGGFTDCEIGGEEVLLNYAYSKSGIVVGYIPYSEVYETRDGTTYWVVAAAIFIAAVVILVVRNKMLRINKKK